MEQYKHSADLTVKDYLSGLDAKLDPHSDQRALQAVLELKSTVERQQRQIKQLETLVEQLRIRVIQK